MAASRFAGRSMSRAAAHPVAMADMAAIFISKQIRMTTLCCVIATIANSKRSAAAMAKVRIATALRATIQYSKSPWVRSFLMQTAANNFSISRKLVNVGKRRRADAAVAE